MKTKRSAAALWLAGALAAMGISHAQTYVEHVVKAFGDFPHGKNPDAALIAGASGNLYGTTVNGGSFNQGAVFKLGKSGYTVLYSFQGGNDGSNPQAGVTLDSQGNLYGPPSTAATLAGVILDSAGNLTRPAISTVRPTTGEPATGVSAWALCIS